MVTLAQATSRDTPFTAAVERGAGAGRQAHGPDRCLHHGRGDVHDATEPALDHAVEHASDHQDRREEVRFERGMPLVAIPLRVAAGRRPAVVRDEDVGSGHASRRASCVASCVTSPTTVTNLDLVSGPELLRRVGDAVGIPAVDGHGNAFSCQRFGARPTEPATRRHDDGVAGRAIPRSTAQRLPAASRAAPIAARSGGSKKTSGGSSGPHDGEADLVGRPVVAALVLDSMPTSSVI